MTTINDKHVETPWYRHYGAIRPHLDYPDTTLYEQVKITAQKHAEKAALNYFGKIVTYKELLRNIDDCAIAFLSLGISKGDVATICMPNTPEAVYAFYALNKIGAVANMIHPLSAENEIRYYLTISKSKLLVTIDLAWKKVRRILNETAVEFSVIVSVKDSMPAVTKVGYQLSKGRKIEKPDYSANVLSWRTLMNLKNRPVVMADAHLAGLTHAAILYSGGTTGSPKGIVLANLNFNASAWQSIEVCANLQAGDTVLAVMPIFHGFGLGICIHTVFCFGGCSILLPQFNAHTFDKTMSRYRPNILIGVPTLYQAFLDNPKIDKMDLSFIKCAISGGDSLSSGLKKKIDDFFTTHHATVKIREGYGLTECTSASCLMPISDQRENSIGVPYPDTYYKIVKPQTFTKAAYGEIGEIVISGPTVMVGYLNNEIESNKILQKHDDGRRWLHTGDLGYMSEDGFIYFKQRLKRIIVSSGYNIYPQYVENVIDEHPDVMMSTVIGIDHPYRQQVAKAYVILRTGVEGTDQLKNEIMTHCEKNLAKYSLPYEIEFRESIPKTLVGKVAYTVLAEEEKIKRQLKLKKS